MMPVMKSNSTHVSVPSHKMNAPSKLAESGTSQFPGKSHETDIALAEGLAHGAVQKAHKKEKVRTAKHDGSVQDKAAAYNLRSMNGGADPCGGCE